MSRKRRNSQSGAVKVLLLLLILLMVFTTALVIYLCIDLVNRDAGSAPGNNGTITLPWSDRETQPPETLPREQVVSTAALGSMGDLLVHKQLNQVARQEDGTYDYGYIFRYMGSYIKDLDYAAANLETTLGGPDCGTPFQGNPLFNTPDAFVDSMKEAGFDMLLTANNHCGDTKAEGILRTLEQVRSRGIATLGTMADSEEDRYSVVDVNGVKLGMVCYTYATNEEDGRPSLNFKPFLTQSGLVNYFLNGKLDRFYSEMAVLLDNMKKDGADFSIVYLHWGEEYELTELAAQRAMAQKLCDMGVDIIIGGHPHVVEPMDLLTSNSDPGHKTVVLYSMGNVVSNQRRTQMDLNTGHTEDGLLFTLTFEKYSDGKSYLLDVDVLPTWVKMTGDQNNPQGYFVLPLDPNRSEDWKTLYDLDDAALDMAFKSYDRTMAIVGDGLQECREYLAQEKINREQYYQDLSAAPQNAA